MALRYRYGSFYELESGLGIRHHLRIVAEFVGKFGSGGAIDDQLSD